MPEPASAALRRLHEEATLTTPDDIPTAQRLHDYFAARATIDDALPALADLVAAVEGELGLGPSLPGKPLTDALAALRERLEARP